MDKTLKFAFLDALMLKPYFKKNIILILVLPIFIAATTQNLIMIITMMFMLTVIFCSYPFALNEKNDIDKFYGTLAINKNKIVSGRYLFSLMLAVVSVILSIIYLFCFSFFVKNVPEVGEIVFTIGVGFLLFSIFMAIQMPIYYKLGYSKAKLWVMAPFFFIAFSAGALSKLFIGNLDLQKKFFAVGKYIENNSALSSIILVLAGLLIMEISLIISQCIYRKKDF